jgi:trehalose-6-phosphate synthase
MSEAMQTALTMKLPERQERWQSLWSALDNRTPLGWGRMFLASLLRSSVRGGRLELVDSNEAELPVAMASFG